MKLKRMGKSDVDGVLWGTLEMDELAELYAGMRAVDTWSVRPPTRAAARKDIAALTVTQLSAVLLV